MITRITSILKIFSRFHLKNIKLCKWASISSLSLKKSINSSRNSLSILGYIFTRNKCSSDGDCRNWITSKSKLLLLFISCVSIVATMLHGGYTRRKAAGLSMTSWNFLPEKYPKTVEEWNSQFSEYKKIPEYLLSDQLMTLEDFKYIYDLEFNHRMLGRVTGVSVILTSIILGYLGPKGDRIRGILYSVMVIMQGLLGWYMVKSGFDSSTINSQDYPTVSAYRLSAHNILGTLLFSLMFYRFVSCLGLKFVNVNLNPKILKISSLLCHFSMLSCLITICYGGLVSGTHSVHINAEEIVSSEDQHDPKVLFSLEPKWRNIFENQVTVQLIHKFLGYITAAMVTTTALGVTASIKGPFLRLKIITNLSILAVCSQVFLGIYCIVSQSDTVRALHQTGSLNLMAILLFLGFELSMLKKGSLKGAESIANNVVKATTSKTIS